MHLVSLRSRFTYTDNCQCHLPLKICQIEYILDVQILSPYAIVTHHMLYTCKPASFQMNLCNSVAIESQTVCAMQDAVIVCRFVHFVPSVQYSVHIVKPTHTPKKREKKAEIEKGGFWHDKVQNFRYDALWCDVMPVMLITYQFV